MEMSSKGFVLETKAIFFLDKFAQKIEETQYIGSAHFL